MNFAKNNLLILITIFFVISSILITTNIIFQPFKSDNQLYVSGRTLYIKIEQPKEIDINSLSNQKTITLGVEVINAASSEILLLVDEKSVEFLSTDGYTYRPLNPKNLNFDLEKPLWGNFNLSRNQMIKGNLAFNVKDSFMPQIFEWKESDRVIINFSQ